MADSTRFKTLEANQNRFQETLEGLQKAQKEMEGRIVALAQKLEDTVASTEVKILEFMQRMTGKDKEPEILEQIPNLDKALLLPTPMFRSKENQSQNLQYPDRSYRSSWQHAPRVELPMFYGERPREWIRKCQKDFMVYQVPKTQKMNIVEMFLEGKAEIWYHSTKLARGHISWEEFCRLVNKRFGECGGQDEEEEYLDEEVELPEISGTDDHKMETRRRLILKFADLIDEHTEDLAMLDSIDVGKLFHMGKILDIPDAADNLRYYAGVADKIHGETLRMSRELQEYTFLEPVGVVGHIIPWNFPSGMFTMKVGPSLAASCTAIVKPAEQMPLSALYYAHLAKLVGILDRVINVVTGFGQRASAAISSHMDIDMISFTGSTKVGRLVMKAAATSNLKPVCLELGDQSPFIIFDDVDVDKVAELAVQGFFFNKGEICIAGSRVFVQEGIYDKFLVKLKEKVKNWVVGDPFEQTSHHGPQVDKKQYERVLAYIEQGKKGGATLFHVGKACDRKGYYIELDGSGITQVEADSAKDVLLEHSRDKLYEECDFQGEEDQETHLVLVLESLLVIEKPEILTQDFKEYKLLKSSFCLDLGNAEVTRPLEGDKTDNLWLNLTDGSIPCGRRNWDGSGGNDHAANHYKATKHSLAMKLGTVTSDLDKAYVYSYSKDDSVEDPLLAQHLAHFAINFSPLQKTEMTNAEMEFDPNTNFDWNRIQENGEDIQLLMGLGYARLANLENSCHMAATMQVLFSTHSFGTRYYVNKSLKEAFDVAYPVRDLNMQLTKLAHGMLYGKYSIGAAEAQEGIRLRMFKAVIAGKHPEFSTLIQQNALEFFLHFIDQVGREHSQNSSNCQLIDPSSSFKFGIEELPHSLPFKIKSLINFRDPFIANYVFADMYVGFSASKVTWVEGFSLEF